MTSSTRIPAQPQKQPPTKLVILDRDGVINLDSDDYIKTVDEWIPIEGSAAAIARLCKAGYQVAVATNQSGIARGYFSVDELNKMHEKMTALVAAEGGQFAHIAYCPHGPDDHCDCRKPLPGLIHQIENALGVSAKDCYMVGDSLRDLQAGQAAGMKAALVLTGKGERTQAKGVGLEQVDVFSDLNQFVEHILN